MDRTVEPRSDAKGGRHGLSRGPLIFVPGFLLMFLFAIVGAVIAASMVLIGFSDFLTGEIAMRLLSVGACPVFLKPT